MNHTVFVSPAPEPRPTRQKYVIGFITSLILTLAAYIATLHHLFSLHILVGCIAGLAFVQFLVQLVFFLHLGTESRPRWRLLVLFFMVGTVFILVVGSIWIMTSLNYRMTPSQVQRYMNDQDGL